MKDDKLISIYTGTEASALLLKGKLEMIGISAVVKKNSNAGTWGVVADNIELFIEPSEQQRAEPEISAFIRNRKIDKY